MRIRVRREILVGLQYLLIGVAAEILAEALFNRWLRRDGTALLKQVAVWSLIAIVLGLSRIAIIILTNVLRRDQWQSISRRNWI